MSIFALDKLLWRKRWLRWLGFKQCPMSPTWVSPFFGLKSTEVDQC